jgi:hypothetical protein
VIRNVLITLSLLHSFKYFKVIEEETDRLCGLVVRVLGYRSGGPGSIPGTTRKKSSESGTSPLSLVVSTTEELLGRNSSGSCLENREYGRRDPSR